MQHQAVFTKPATGEVLADVASGGEAEINQAVAAAKEAFPKWANLPMKERARLMRRLGDLIDQNVPEIIRSELMIISNAPPQTLPSTIEMIGFGNFWIMRVI